MTRTKQQRPRHILDPNDRGVLRDSTVTLGEEQASSDAASDEIEVGDSMQGHAAGMRVNLPSPPPLRRDYLTPVSNISSCGDESLLLPAKGSPSPRSPQSTSELEDFISRRSDDKTNVKQSENNLENLHSRLTVKSDKEPTEMPMADPNSAQHSYTHLDYIRYIKEVIFNMRKDGREASTNGPDTTKKSDKYRYTNPPYGGNIADTKNSTNGLAKIAHEPLWQHMFHPLQLMAKFILESQKNPHSTVENPPGANVPNIKLTHNDDSIPNVTPKLHGENGDSTDEQNFKTETKWNDMEDVYADNTNNVRVASGEANAVAFRPYLPSEEESGEKHESPKTPIDIEHMCRKRKASKGEPLPEMDLSCDISEKNGINLEPSPKVGESDDWKQRFSANTMETVASNRRQEERTKYGETRPQQSNALVVPSSDSRLSVSPARLFQQQNNIGSPYHPCSNYSSPALSVSSQSEMPSYIYSPVTRNPHLPLRLPFAPLSEFPPIPSPAYYNPWAMVCPPFHPAMDPVTSNPFLRRRFQHDLPLSLSNRYPVSNRNGQPHRPHTPTSSARSDAPLRKRSSISRNKIHSNSALDSLHAAIVREAKEMNKGMDPENMYIECPICHKKIKRLYHFQRHMRIHSGEKSHTCPFCPYKSVRKDNLKSHMKTHEKGKYDASKRPQMRRENNDRHAFPYSRAFLMAGNKGILHTNGSQGLCEPVSPISTNNSLHLTPFSDNNQSLSESMSPASTSNENQNEALVPRRVTNDESEMVSQKQFSTGLKDPADSYSGYAPLIAPYSTQEKDSYGISRDKKPRSSFLQRQSSEHKSFRLFDDVQEAANEFKYNKLDEHRNMHNQPLKHEFGTIANHALEIRKRQNSNEALRESKPKSQKLAAPSWYKTDMEKILLQNTNNCNNKNTNFLPYFSPSDTIGLGETASTTKHEYENVTKNRNILDNDQGKFSIERNKSDRATDSYQNGETGNGCSNFTASTVEAKSLSDHKYGSDCSKKFSHSSISDCGKDGTSDQGRRVDSNRNTPISERRSSGEESVGTKTTNADKFFHSAEEKLRSPLPNTTQLAYSLGSIFKNQQRTASPDDTNKRRVNSCWLGTSRESKCRLCDFVATSNSSLQEHMATHREDGLYKCQQCDYHGKNLSKLIEHIRIHTGERPFQCDQCSYAAKRKDNLAQHKSVRHDKNRFKGSSKASKISSQSETRISTISPRDSSKYRDTEYKSLFLPTADQLNPTRALIGNEKARANFFAKYDYPASDELRTIDSTSTTIESSSIGMANKSPNPLNSYVFPTHPFLTCDNMMSSFMYRHPLMTTSMFHAMPSLPSTENPLSNTALNYASRFTNSPQYNESMRRNPHLNPGGNKFSTTLEECAR